MSRECDLARRLMYAFYSIDQFFVAKGKNAKINYAELCLLYGLDSGSMVSQKELAELLYAPTTTINTIVKAWEKQGLLVQVPVEGKRREKHLVLTEAGKQYAREHLDFIHQAEEKAMQKTLVKYSEDFIEALEYYSACIRACNDRSDHDAEEREQNQ